MPVKILVRFMVRFAGFYSGMAGNLSVPGILRLLFRFFSVDVPGLQKT